MYNEQRPRSETSDALAIIAAAVLLAAMLVSALATPASGQSGPGLGEGTWRVVFFLDQRASLGGVDFDYSGHGSAIVEVADGGTASGEWNLSLTARGVDVAANSTGVAIGTVSGDASTQILDFDSLTATDAATGLSITMTADELPVSGGGQFVATGRGCSAVTGDWVIPFNDTQLQGDFIAERLGVGGGETDADLRDEGLALIDSARNGTLDPSELNSFIQRAEGGAENTARAAGCDPETARLFGGAAALLIDALLSESLILNDSIDDSVFMEFYRVVLRSGVLETHPDQRASWELAFLFRLGGGVSSDDPDDWDFWLPVARQMGETEAEAILAAKICEERGGVMCDEADE